MALESLYVHSVQSLWDTTGFHSRCTSHSWPVPGVVSCNGILKVALLGETTPWKMDKFNVCMKYVTVTHKWTNLPLSMNEYTNHSEFGFR